MDNEYEFEDISAQVFGRYQFCTLAEDGKWYADCDLVFRRGKYYPVKGAVPSPHQGGGGVRLKKPITLKPGESISLNMLREQQNSPPTWWQKLLAFIGLR